MYIISSIILLFIWFVIFDFLLNLCFLTCDFTYLLFAQFCSPRVFFFVAFFFYFLHCTGFSFYQSHSYFCFFSFSFSCYDFLSLLVGLFYFYLYILISLFGSSVAITSSFFIHPTPRSHKRPQYLTACVPMCFLILLYLLSAIVSHRYLSHDYSICLKPGATLKNDSFLIFVSK